MQPFNEIRNALMSFSPGRVLLDRTLYPRYGLAIVRIGYGLAVMAALLPDATRITRVFGTSRSYLPLSDGVDSPGDATILFLWTACIVAAVTLVLGLFTRLSTLILLLTYRSLVNYNDFITDGGDNLLAIALIYLVFANTSEVWSVDARIRHRLPLSLTNARWYRPIANGAWLLMVMQVCVIYIVAGLSKVQGTTWLGGEGVTLSMTSIDFLVHAWLNDIVLGMGGVATILSIVTVFVQIYFPFLIFNKWFKIPTLVLMIMFHAAIGVFMGLTSFALAMIASEMIFVPDRLMQRILPGKARQEAQVRIPVPVSTEKVSRISQSEGVEQNAIA